MVINIRSTNTNNLKRIIVYHILIDRFAGENIKFEKWHKPEFIGGNIKGIINKIDYIRNLSADVILLSPFYETTKYHGYHITNYYNIDPHFGKIDDLKKLIETCRNYNIDVWVDFVPNHCSSKHPFFIEAQTDRNSKYTKWFYFIKWPQEYLCFLNYKELPKFNLENPEVQEYFIDCAKYWIKIGIKGFRIDHIIGLPIKFLKKFIEEIKKFDENIIIIGEAWLNNIPFKNLRTLGIKNKYLKWLLGFKQEKIQLEYKNITDGILDFSFRNILINSFKKMNNNYSLEEINFIIEYKLKKHYQYYNDNYLPFTFLDNHDMNRFLYECNNDLNKLKLAFEIQLKINFPAIIYYGTEAGLIQKNSVNTIIPYSDLNARMPFDWNNINNDLLSFVKKLIKERKST